MVILLIMPLMSCVTKIKKENKVVVDELVFPVFPDLSNYEHKRTENGVLVSDEYILALSKYKIQIEETEKTYNDIRELYDEIK